MKEPKRRICGAKTRSGKPCQKSPCEGSNRCRLHGGKSPGAPLKSGRYSKYLPKGLLGAFEEAIQGEQDLRDEAAVVEALLTERLRLMGGTTSAEAWGRMSEFLELLAERSAEDEGVSLLEALPKLQAMVRDGAAIQGHERAALSLMHSKANLLLAMARQRQAEASSLTAREAQALVAYLLDAVNRHVKEPSALRGIQAEIARLRAPEPSEGAGGARRN
ncbi:MAG: hypothetical protein MH204_08280 [Fimbriimonadaceae bacterium]|nr:hypothetical protein [Fimbriimonadaceae bacterium]